MVHIFHWSRGGSLAALVGVCRVWNLEPLASGGQSGHKLIPHIICQFLYAWEKKLWTRTYSVRDQVPSCPVFTRAKIKSRFGILNSFRVTIPTNYITELNELIYAGSKLVCENIGIPSKSTKKQQKPGWEIRLESQIKKLRKQARMMKRGAEISEGKKEQATWGKITVQLEEINQKILAKEGTLKRYRQKGKQYRQNRTFQNNERKFYQKLGGSDTKTYQQPDAKETEWFSAKIWEPKKHNENAEWINNITRELDGIKEGPKMEIHVDLLKTTLKRISNMKAPDHDGLHGFWFKKFTSIHGRLALEMNRCLQDAHVPEWMTKGRTTLIQKDPSKEPPQTITDP